MLSAATIGMVGYGIYSAGYGIADLFVWRMLTIPANLGLILFGLLLILAAAFVRVQMPGALALAIGAVLGLQAITMMNAVRLHGEDWVAMQMARGIFAAILVLLAYIGGWRETQQADRPPHT